MYQKILKQYRLKCIKHTVFNKTKNNLETIQNIKDTDLENDKKTDIIS